MRLLVLSVGVVGIACLGATCVASALAQTGQWGQEEDQIPPYRTHVDMRHGHNRVYPDRGAVLREVPRGAIDVNYAGISYRFAAGVWYERLGPAYIVVAPPIGLIVPSLPGFATSFNSAGKPYLYADDVFYRPRPDLGGYEVVNDPQDAELKRSHVPAGASASHVASAAAIAGPASASHLAYAAPAAGPASVSDLASAAPTAGPAAAQAPAHAQSTAAVLAPPAVAPSSESPAPSPVVPALVAPQAPPIPANPTAVAISPRQGQSAEQQAMDRYECYRFAVAQTGFDPLAANSGTATEARARRAAEYSRAQAACLESRNYSVP